jgi:hypothetical protein
LLRSHPPAPNKCRSTRDVSGRKTPSISLIELPDDDRRRDRLEQRKLDLSRDGHHIRGRSTIGSHRHNERHTATLRGSLIRAGLLLHSHGIPKVLSLHYEVRSLA